MYERIITELFKGSSCGHEKEGLAALFFEMVIQRYYGAAGISPSTMTSPAVSLTVAIVGAALVVV